jgi:dTDP-4-amino-4,6-dideoxygalactose transaminase
MKVPLVDLQAQYAGIKPEADAAIARVLQSCAFAGGPEVRAFEEAFAKYCGQAECVGVSSGTSAIEIAARALGIGPGDEVIVPANTFFATAEGVSILGAKPVFADVDEDTALMDPAALERAITPRTKLIIPVHLYGQMADMPAIMRIADARGIPVIEDCAQAHGATTDASKAGQFGIAATFSFYPGKNLGAYGEAGAVVTDDASIASFSRMFREHGSLTKYEHKIVARNDRMDGLQGAVLAAKLPHLDAWNAKRREWAGRYRELFKDDARIKIIGERAGAIGVYHLFVVRIANRDAVLKKLHDAGVGAGVHYPVPLHLQECYKDLGHKPGDFPVTERLSREILSLPLYPELTEAQVRYVTETLKAAL